MSRTKKSERGVTLSRRFLLGSAFLASASAVAGEREGGPDSPNSNTRSAQSYHVRVGAAMVERSLPQPSATPNGDEQDFPNKIGNYSKGLPHNSLGEVDSAAYQMFSDAMTNGCRQDQVEQMPMGSPSAKLVNPVSGMAFDLQGADSHHLAIPPAPKVTSAQAAGEAVELYWAALLRDVPFTEYDSNPMAQAAAAELSKLSDFRGPKVNGQVTTGTLFRGFTAGDVMGPYISQFLLKPIPFGAQYVDQKIRTAMPASDFLTQYAEWLPIQNGAQPNNATVYDPVRRYVRNARDMGSWVHVDVLYQAYFNAMLILMQAPDATDTITGGGLGVPLNPGNPYLKSKNQTGFGTFGEPAIAAAVAEVSTRALKAVWYQKWVVHRRLRPEEFGGLVHNTLAGSAKYPLHSDVLNSEAVDRVHSNNGSYLLPMVFPEGCPLHPSYGAGHATVAGACVTLLKALYDESVVILNPVVPTSDGLGLMPYTGSDAGSLTVGGELNKLAANVATGRNGAGVHWRSDYTESLKLGEAVAISVLRDQHSCYGENFDGFTLTRFDGTKITV